MSDSEVDDHDERMEEEMMRDEVGIDPDARDQAAAKLAAAKHSRADLQKMVAHLMKRCTYVSGMLGSKALHFSKGADILALMLEEKEGILAGITTKADAVAVFCAALSSSDNDATTTTNPAGRLLARVEKVKVKQRGRDGKLRTTTKRDVETNRVILRGTPPALQTEFAEDGRYVWLAEGDNTWTYIYLGGFALVVLALLLFRFWPVWMRDGVWWISVSLLLFIVVVSVLRLIIFTLGLIVGYEVWLFPFMWDDVMPWEAFGTLLSVDPSSASTSGVGLRVAILVVALSFAGWVYVQPVEDRSLFLEQQVEFVGDLYSGKLLAEMPANPNVGTENAHYNIPGLEELERLAAEDEEEDEEPAPAAEEGVASAEEGASAAAEGLQAAEVAADGSATVEAAAEAAAAEEDDEYEYVDEEEEEDDEYEYVDDGEDPMEIGAADD